MSKSERRMKDLGVRQHHRMVAWDAAMTAKDVDEAYRNLRVAVKLKRKRDAMAHKMRERGLDVD